MKVSDYLSREEVAYFTSKNDWLAAGMVIGNWVMIAAIFALLAAYPNPLTVLVALVLFAGRQLGLSVLMHDCGHNTFFSTKWKNEVIGQWFCALPVLNDQPSYAKGHLNHHRLAGTLEDPDLPNYRAYPISKESFRRKVIRDLTGQTGYKLVSYVVQSALGAFRKETREHSKPFVKELFVQFVIFAVLFAFGIGWTFLVWFASFLTTFMLVVRIRQVAEHGATPDLYDLDPRKNTRTVDAPAWQKFMFAPFGVNYHMEHHFMASVPCYRLKALRKHLREKGALEGVPAFRGYGALLSHAVTA